MEHDRHIRDTEIDDWVAALHEVEEGDWNTLHAQGAQLTLQAMAASENSYTGADLYQAFASSDTRTALREDATMDLYTLTEIDTVIWQDLSQRAAILVGREDDQLAEKTGGNESDT